MGRRRAARKGRHALHASPAAGTFTPMSDAKWPAPYRREVVDEAEVVALPHALEWATHAVARYGSLFAWAEARPDAGGLQGRGVAHLVPAAVPAAPFSEKGAEAGGQRWVVRHYRRGGLVARFVEDRFLDVGERRPLRELRASHAARERGIPTPEVVALGVYPTGVWYRADIVTRWVPDSIDLAAALFDGDPSDERRERAMRAAGELVRHAHRAGVVHNDLNLKNVLLTGLDDGAPSAWLLDLDRAVVVRDEVARFERDQMLRRFSRSLRKTERLRRERLGESPRMAFALGYGRGAGDTASDTAVEERET